MSGRQTRRESRTSGSNFGGKAVSVSRARSPDSIQDRLHLLRNALGLSLRGFAADLEARTGYSVSHDSVRQYENGRSVPADYVKAVCQAHGVNAEWVLFGTGPLGREGETPDERSSRDVTGPDAAGGKRRDASGD